MRWIDADKVKMMDYEQAADYIENAEPDYDIEAVVERLEDNSTYADIDGVGRCFGIESDKAIEIVRGGAK